MAELGPDNATLRVNTYREGVAAKVGHDLVIEVGEWSATVEPGDAPTFELTADSRSLRVVEGSGGAKPLTDSDCEKIRKSIDDDVLKGEPIRFRSTGPGEGELEIAGSTQPAQVDVTVAEDGSVKGSAKLVQSRWGIKPYKAMMGALKVADEVEITVEGKLP